MNWFRFYTDALNNPKAQGLPPDIFKFWINLLCVARMYNGILPSEDHLWFVMRADSEWGKRCLDRLIESGFVDRVGDELTPHDWYEHQYDSDDGALRMRKHREKRKRESRSESLVTNKSRTRLEKNRLERIEQTKPAATNKIVPISLDEVRIALMEFPGARKLQGMPDDSLLIKCCAMAGNNVDELAKALRGLALSGKKPELSWGWFLTVLPSKLNGAAR